MAKIIQYFLSNHVNLTTEALVLVKKASEAAKLSNFNKIYGADEVAEELEKILFRLLANENLLNEKRFQKLLLKITNWYPENIPPEDLWCCGLIQQVLLGMLPKAQQEQRKQQLLQACRGYKRYLEQAIRNEIVDSPITLLKSQHEKLQLAVDKYKAIREITNTLTSNNDVNIQLQQFKQKINYHRSLLEKRRDTASMTFIKVVTTILSFGMAVLFGIWKTKGKDAINKMEPYIKYRN